MRAVLFARHKDGHRIPVHVRSIPLEDAQGNIIATAELFQQHGSQSELRWAGDPGSHTQDGLNGPSVIASEAYLNSKLKSSEGLAVFMIELQEKEAMAKQRGWEMVYTMTRTMVHTITDLLSTPHFLGRWRGDQFLIIVPASTGESFQKTLGALEGWAIRAASPGGATAWGARVLGTLLHGGDTMESLLSRIDQVKDGPVKAR